MKSILKIFPGFFLAISGGFFVEATCQTTEGIAYGDFQTWVKRNVRESIVIGGHNKVLYEVGPETVIEENVPYCTTGDSPWATSNVFSRFSGVVKASNTVTPHLRSHDDICAKLTTKREKVKVLGVVNFDYVVAGSLFLGDVLEPITDLSHLNSKVNMGMEFDKRPKYLSLDFMYDVPFTGKHLHSSGFESEIDPEEGCAKIYVLLQQRYEDENGNIHAKRIGTGGELISDATSWQNDHLIAINYGDVSDDEELPWLGLKTGDDSFYAFNSHGELVPILEDEWGEGDETPTHVIIMIRSSDEEPSSENEEVSLYVDNIGFVY